VSMERPEEYMDHTAGRALALATTPAPEPMRAAPLRMDHTARAVLRKLTTLGREPMRLRVRARTSTAVGARRTCSVVMIG
jgi:hypothetical protein